MTRFQITRSALALALTVTLTGTAALATPMATESTPNQLLILLPQAPGQTMDLARRGRGADDGPGHVRHGRGTDDAPGHVSGRDRTRTKTKGGSTDDSGSGKRRGRGSDDGPNHS